MTETALLIGIGIAGGFVAGLLGLGGAVVLAPLLLTVPGSLGLPGFAMRDVASITLVHGLLWAAVSLWSRGAPGAAVLGPALLPGLAGAAAGLAGGLLSARLPERFLLVLYAAFATLAGLLLLVPRRPAGLARARRHRLRMLKGSLVEGLPGETERVRARPVRAQRVRAQRVRAQRVRAQRVRAHWVRTQRVRTQRVRAQWVRTQRVRAQWVRTQRVRAQWVRTQRVRAQWVGAQWVRVRPAAGRGRISWSWGALGVAAGTGAVAGLVGAAGGFLLEPLVARLVRPRRAVETAVVFIVLVSAVGGLVGKGLAGQLNLWLAGPLVGGAVPAAWWGGELARQLSPRRLAWAALACTWVAAAGLWLLVLPGLAVRVRPGHLYLLATVPAALVALWLAGRRGWGLALSPPRVRTPGRSRAAERPAALLPEELRRMVVEGPVPQIIDLRDPESFAARSLPGSLNIAWPQLEAWLEVADPHDGAVFVCDDGTRSARAALLAAALGHRTRYLEGGMAAWEALQAETPGNIPAVMQNTALEMEGPPGPG